MEKLGSFSPEEVQMILCGNQSPSWSAEDIINYTEPKLGYTRERYVAIDGREMSLLPQGLRTNEFPRAILQCSFSHFDIFNLLYNNNLNIYCYDPAFIYVAF